MRRKYSFRQQNWSHMLTWLAVTSHLQCKYCIAFFQPRANMKSRRMSTCIYGFRTRRRLSPDQSLYFNEYLFLGGVDTSSGPFCGQDAEDPSFISSIERRDDALNDIVAGPGATSGRFYDGNPANWTVDFAGVASGFFSTALPALTGLDLASIDRAIAVVEGFLRYILQHDVCPEYEADINNTLRIAARARVEFAAMTQFNASLPGLFNLSGSRLFADSTFEDWSLIQLNISDDFSSELVFYTSLAALGENSHIRLTPDPSKTTSLDCVLELCSIELPSQDVIRRFRRIATGTEHKPLGYKPLGKAVFVTATVEDGWAKPDQTKDTPKAEEVVLFFETDILENMKTGMKVSATVCQTASGLRFLKAVHGVYPSFYTFLPQQLMKGFKTPRAEERPAQSIHDIVNQDREVETE